MEKSKKYRVKIDWSGYSRGVSEYILYAKDEEEAKECYYDGKKVYHRTVRDDTEKEIQSVKEEA